MYGNRDEETASPISPSTMNFGDIGLRLLFAITRLVWTRSTASLRSLGISK